MKIGHTGETLGEFGLSGRAAPPIFVELAGKVVVGQENIGQMVPPGVQKGSRGKLKRQPLLEPRPRGGVGEGDYTHVYEDNEERSIFYTP